MHLLIFQLLTGKSNFLQQLFTEQNKIIKIYQKYKKKIKDNHEETLPPSENKIAPGNFKIKES